MSFYLKASLATGGTSLELAGNSVEQMLSVFTLPLFLRLRRTSDGAIEIVRAVYREGAQALTIVRGQQGTTALAFTTADTCIPLNQPASLGVEAYYVGSPAAASAAGAHAAVTLGAAPQVVTTAMIAPDVPRVPSIVGNDVAIVGNVIIVGPDYEGNSVSQTIALNGTTTVIGTKALAGAPTSITYPVETNVGTDTVSVGWSDKLGMPVALPTDMSIKATYDGAVDTYVFTPGDTVAGTYFDLTTALAGDPVWMLYVNPF